MLQKLNYNNFKIIHYANVNRQSIRDMLLFVTEDQPCSSSRWRFRCSIWVSISRSVSKIETLTKATPCLAALWFTATLTVA